MDWFLYDNGLHHERVKQKKYMATGLISEKQRKFLSKT